MHLRPYLIFKGECQEALELYQRAFQIEATEIMRYSDIPQDPNNPVPFTDEQMKWIAMATLPFDENFIRMSDTIGELNDTSSQRISLAVEFEANMVKNAFEVLSQEGKVETPLMQTFFSPCYGLVYDKFGVMWTLVGTEEK